MSQVSYTLLHEKGLLKGRVVQALAMLEDCRLCPRACGVNRLQGELGFCRIGRYAKVASFGAHFGEEAPLVGTHGSGTIFFSSCNLLCSFCQNHDISHLRDGVEVGAKELAGMMLRPGGQRLPQHQLRDSVSRSTPDPGGPRACRGSRA